VADNHAPMQRASLGSKIVTRRMTSFLLAVCAFLIVSHGVGPLRAQQRPMILASTTSTENSGLFAHLLPQFQAATGIEVRVVAVGSGQALSLAARGDADAVLVHDRPGEDDLVAKGHAIERQDVMYNDFVIVGPAGDPASIKGLRDVKAAFSQIACAQVAFVSRGDDSGTHRTELRIWQAAGGDLKPKGAAWYRELGSGMGATLNTATQMNAYVLTDRATWASFKNRGTLEIVVAGDPLLLNPYGSLRVNPAKGAHIMEEPARIWHEWLTSPQGRAAIKSFKIDGEQLFFLPDQMPRG
jgi:tungstate transport system substrate-binding protein